jgi:hypothetical protein
VGANPPRYPAALEVVDIHHDRGDTEEAPRNPVFPLAAFEREQADLPQRAGGTPILPERIPVDCKKCHVGTSVGGALAPLEAPHRGDPSAVVHESQHLAWAVWPVTRWTALPMLTGHSRAIIDSSHFWNGRETRCHCGLVLRRPSETGTTTESWWRGRRPCSVAVVCAAGRYSDYRAHKRWQPTAYNPRPLWVPAVPETWHSPPLKLS